MAAETVCLRLCKMRQVFNQDEYFSALTSVAVTNLLYYFLDPAEYWKNRCDTLEHLLTLANNRIGKLARQVKVLKAANKKVRWQPI